MIFSVGSGTHKGYLKKTSIINAGTIGAISLVPFRLTKPINYIVVQNGN